MNEEAKEIPINLGGHKAKVVLGDSSVQKKVDKLSAMRIALTYIESQNMQATPQKAIEIANEFLAWLEGEEKNMKSVGLGDVIHKITKRLGIKECEGCGKRREVLNKYRLPKFKI